MKEEFPSLNGSIINMNKLSNQKKNESSVERENLIRSQQIELKNSINEFDFMNQQRIFGETQKLQKQMTDLQNFDKGQRKR